MTTIQDRIIKDFRDKCVLPKHIGIPNIPEDTLIADINQLEQFLIQSIKEVEEETRKEYEGEEKLINGKIYKTYLANAWCYNCNKIIQFNVPKGYKVSNALSPVNEYKPKCPICDTQSLRKLTEKERLSITNKEKQ